MTRYLVGYRGWLGRSVLQAIPDAVGVPAADVLESGMGAFPSRAIAHGSVIINVAGAKHGDHTVLHRLNVQLPEVLAGLAEVAEARVVHLGSASEYGLDAGHLPVSELSRCRPESEYGRSKLAGTRALVQAGRACVLRLFNIASGPPQTGSPLSDVLERVLAGVEAAAPIELLSADTQRDWVTKDFVVRSILRASEGDLTGVFNIASGRLTSMRDLATAMARALGSDVPVKDIARFPATAILGDPTLWHEASGLSEALSPAELARVVLRHAGSHYPRGVPR